MVIRGQHLGTYTRCFFRDYDGGAVAFTSGATGGPILPLKVYFTDSTNQVYTSYQCDSIDSTNPTTIEVDLG